MKNLYTRIAALGTKMLTIVALCVAIVIGLSLYSCSQNRQRAAQAGQSDRSAEATAAAAEEAVETVLARTEDEAEIDEIVDRAMKEIDDAEDIPGARRATVTALCRLRPAYCNDAAAELQQPDS